MKLRSFVQLAAAATNVTMLTLNRLEMAQSTDYEAIKHLLFVVEILGQQATLINESRRKYLKHDFVEEHQAPFVCQFKVTDKLYCGDVDA